MTRAALGMLAVAYPMALGVMTVILCVSVCRYEDAARRALMLPRGKRKVGRVDAAGYIVAFVAGMVVGVTTVIVCAIAASH